MRKATMAAMVMAACWVGLCQAQQVLSVATAQNVATGTVTASGRLQPVISARLSPRVSGQLTALGTDGLGHRLDAGMLVTRGQILFQIDDTTFANHAAAAAAKLASESAALAHLKAKTRPERLEQLTQAVAELDLRIANQMKDVERYKRLVEVDKTLPEKRLEDAALELGALQAQRKAAQARLEEAVNGATATEIALAEARVREEEVSVKAAADDLRDTVMRAPFDGLITRRFKSPGDYLASTPPTEVMEIVSLDELEVEFRLPEAFLGRIEEGRTGVRLTSPLLQAAVEAKITRIIREIDATRGTFACRSALTAAQRQGLMPGAFMTAEIGLSGGGGPVVVPLRAVVREGAQAVVFVAADGVMQRRPVETGDRLTEGVLLKSGLRDGERVVVGPAEMLRDGAALPAYLGAANPAARPATAAGTGTAPAVNPTP